MYDGSLERQVVKKFQVFNRISTTRDVEMSLEDDVKESNLF